MSDSAQMNAPKRGGLRRVLGAGLALLLVAVLVEMLRRRWVELPPDMLSPAWGGLVASFVLLVASSASLGLCWRSVLAALGGRLSVIEAVYIQFLSQAGKYIPGKVMLVVGKVALAAEQGAGRSPALASAIYEQVLLILSGCLLVLVLAAAAGVELAAAHCEAVVVAVLLGLAALHPALMRRVLKVMMRLTRSRETVPDLSYAKTLQLLSGYAIPWCALGLAFYLFVSSFAALSPRFLPDMAGVVVLSGILGLISLFAPAGLGVREAVITAMLSAYFPLAVSLAIPLAFRVAVTAADLVALLVALSLRPYCRRLAADGGGSPQPGGG